MAKGLGFTQRGASLVDPSQLVMYGLYALVGLTTAGVGAALVIRQSNAMVGVIVAASGLYLAALLLRNYTEFMSLHELVAVQGRYALPLLMPMFALAMMGLTDSLRYAQYAKTGARDWIRTVGSMEVRDAYLYSYVYWLRSFQRLKHWK